MPIDLYLVDKTKEVLKYSYDQHASLLVDQYGNEIKFIIDYPANATTVSNAARYDPNLYVRPSPESPGKKAKGKFKLIKIQLGLGCNYDCAYCLQATMPRTGSTPKEVDDFVKTMDSWVSDDPNFDGNGLTIELRGGEPFVYWKTMKPLAEKIRAKYPLVQLTVCTNGSLLDFEKNAWLDEMGFAVSISHDGPGQHVRGPDPLNDPKQREAILDLYRRLKDKGRMSFNAMLNAKNQSRSEVQQFFINATGDRNVPVGEGGIIDSYDDSGVELSFDPESAVYFRRRAFLDITRGAADNFSVINMKINSFMKSLAERRSSNAVKQKCGMDLPEHIAVDMKGNVLTCQNVQASEFGMNGNSHKIGEVTNIDAVRLNTVKHWENRKNCRSCPVLQICGGSCMYLDGDLFDASCENSFTDSVVILAVALKDIFGGTLLYIDGEGIPEHRKNVFGMAEIVDGEVRMIDGERIVLPEVKKKKPFPIPVVSK